MKNPNVLILSALFFVTLTLWICLLWMISITVKILTVSFSHLLGHCKNFSLNFFFKQNWFKVRSTCVFVLSIQKLLILKQHRSHVELILKRIVCFVRLFLWPTSFEGNWVSLMGFSLKSGAAIDGNAPYQELQIKTLANPGI